VSRVSASFWIAAVVAIPIVVVEWPLRAEPPQPAAAERVAKMSSISGHTEARKAVDIAARVVTPAGADAVQAKVALAEPGQEVEIQDGDLDEDLCPCTTSDSRGRFHLATDAQDFWLVVTHSSGYLQLQCSSDSPPKILKLTPWARIEGTYNVERRPKPGVQLLIRSHANLMVRDIAAHLMVQGQQTTDRNGHFLFERVVPGDGIIGSGGEKDENGNWSAMTRDAHFDSGKTTRIDFGITGRPVIGQLRGPSPKQTVPWKSARVSVHRFPAHRGEHLEFLVTVDSQGNFSVDDVPVGEYWLNAMFNRPGIGRLVGHRFSVPANNEKLWRRPIDLGVLTLLEDPGPGVRALKK
jgi:hypothetical protein